MTLYVNIHPETPQPRLLSQAADIIRNGGIAVIPTDSSYALACHLGDKEALDRIREIRQMDERHHLTLMCRDLSEIAHYARVDNAQYRLLKAVTPGCYVFILEGTKELPRRVMHPKRKTIGLRVPDNVVVLGLLEELQEPLLTTSLVLPGEEEPMTEGWEIRDRLDEQVDLIIDAGYCGTEPTTVIDLTEKTPVLVRSGKGSLDPFGFA